MLAAKQWFVAYCGNSLQISYRLAQGLRALSSAAEARPEWKDPVVCKEFLTSFASLNGFHSDDGSGWARVRHKDIISAGGGGLLARFRGSLTRALEEVLGSASSRIRKMQSAGSKWDSHAVCKALLDAVAERHGVKNVQDWRRVTVNDVGAMGGAGLLERHAGSLACALSFVYGFDVSMAHQFRAHVPRGHWQHQENRVAFIRELAANKGASGSSARQQVLTRKDVADAGGSGLLRKEYGGLSTLLAEAFPASSVMELALAQKRIPSSVLDGAFTSSERAKAVLECLAEPLGVRSLRDWRRVSYRQLSNSRGSGLLRRGSLRELLEVAFPGEPWHDKGRQRHSQGMLLRQLRSILP